MLRVQNYDCSRRAEIGTANAFTKRDVENSFPGTQCLCKQGTTNVLNSNTKILRAQLNVKFNYVSRTGKKKERKRQRKRERDKQREK